MSIGDPSTARERATQASRPTLPVAVVMTAHSGAPFLKEALAGIREQTAPAAECIVVYDIFDHNVTAGGVRGGAARLLRHPLGLNAARNAAIVGTTQPWIAFMDTDDEWVRHKLEAQWGAIATCPDVGAVFSNCWEFDTEGVTWRALFERLAHYWAIERRAVASGVKYCEHESLVRQFLLGNFIWRSTMLVRRDLLLRVGLFEPALAHLEERDCWLRLLALTRVAMLSPRRPLHRGAGRLGAGPALLLSGVAAWRRRPAARARHPVLLPCARASSPQGRPEPPEDRRRHPDPV